MTGVQTCALPICTMTDNSDGTSTYTVTSADIMNANGQITFLTWSGDADSGNAQVQADYLSATINYVNNNVPTSIPIINSTDGTDRSNQDLNCFFTASDPQGDAMHGNISWFNNSVRYLTTSGYSWTNGTPYSYTLGSGNTSYDDSWLCEAQIFDNNSNSAFMNSSSLTVLVTNKTLVFVQPTTESPNAVNDNDNITVTFLFRFDNDNITSNVTLNQVTVGSVIANIRNTTTAPVPVSVTTIDYEGFTSGFGSWVQATFDTDDWLRGTSTPSGSTGQIGRASCRERV